MANTCNEFKVLLQVQEQITFDFFAIISLPWTRKWLGVVGRVDKTGGLPFLKICLTQEELIIPAPATSLSCSILRVIV